MKARAGELVAAGSALALLVTMFAFAWYGVDETHGGVVRTEDAWHALSLVRWIMLLTILASIGGATAPWIRKRVGPRGRGAWISLLGWLTAALLVIRVLIDLPSSSQVPDQKLGALLGMACAFGIGLGGWEALRHARHPDRRRAGS